MTSDSWTVFGTVLSMRSSGLPHCELKNSGSRANARMVVFPSAAKIRASEFVVLLNPTANGSVLVPSIHCVALVRRCH